MLGQQHPTGSPHRITPSEALELSDALAAGLRLTLDYAAVARGVAADYAARCSRDLMAGDLWSALRAASLAVEAERIAAREAGFVTPVRQEQPREVTSEADTVVDKHRTAHRAAS